MGGWRDGWIGGRRDGHKGGVKKPSLTKYFTSRGGGNCVVIYIAGEFCFIYDVVVKPKKKRSAHHYSRFEVISSKLPHCEGFD